MLQAVDGVALKAMVDLWTGADEDRSSLFAGALAVRQIEIGLDALFALLLALAFLAFGIGLLIAPSGSDRWAPRRPPPRGRSPTTASRSP